MNTPIPTGGPFTASFTLTNLINSDVTAAGGITFGFQNHGLNALGGTGNGFGYAGITPSAALAINLYSPNTQGSMGVGVGVLTNGASPSTIEPMVPAGADGSFGDPIQVVLKYDGTNLNATFIQEANVHSMSFPLNIAAPVGSSAYFGFTGSFSTFFSQYQISNFSFTSPGYNSPTLPLPGVYANNVVVTNSSTIQVTAPAGVPTVAMGTLTMGSGTMLTIIPDPSHPAGTPFGLTFTGAT